MQKRHNLMASIYLFSAQPIISREPGNPATLVFLYCAWAITTTITMAVIPFFQIQLLSVSAGSSVAVTGVYGPPGGVSVRVSKQVLL